MRSVVLVCLASALAACSSSPPVAPAATSGASTGDAPPAASASADDPYLAKVVVERSAVDVVGDDDARHDILWNAFANQPYEQQFSEMSSADWFPRQARFRARLVELAAAAALDAPGLRRALEALPIAADAPVAEIPVGAFAAHSGADPVWIVVFKWETPELYESDGLLRATSLGHIRIVAVRAADGTVVGEARCM